MAYKKYITHAEKLEAIASNNRRYHKTRKGKLMLTFNNMTRRVQGYVKPHLYKGLEICARDVFYAWSLGSNSFEHLYNNWVDSDFKRRLSPSIDRIDTDKGYVLGNIQWITLSENSQKGSISRHESK
jgi:hypothetical protein|tara:strand:+ start:671 stop:1051 length:381 start_codon:yes stop_codon:yes gene_type:complete